MPSRRIPSLAHPRLIEEQPAPRLTLLRQPDTDQLADLRAEVEHGLSLSPKRLAPRFFYDEVGSELFERITATPEYYPTRTEEGILRAYGTDIIAAAFGSQDVSDRERPVVVELGSGSSSKTRVLLDAFGRERSMVYTPIDVSEDPVKSFGLSLLTDYPALSIRGLVCDYHQAMDTLPVGRRLFLFLGSSLGNYDLLDARKLLALVRGAMTPRDSFLLGLDLKKDPAVLNAAYNDASGVTAAFNLNLLTRINRELGGHFDLVRFSHVAFYNQAAARIEMHLESLEDQVIRIDALGRSYGFRRRERLHTENSYKYGAAEVTTLLQGTGLALAHQWRDPLDWFSLNLLSPA